MLLSRSGSGYTENFHGHAAQYPFASPPTMSKKRNIAASHLMTFPSNAVDCVPAVAHADALSADGRRIQREAHLCFAPPPARRDLLVARTDLFDNASVHAIEDEDGLDKFLEEQSSQGDQPDPSRKQTRRFASLVRFSFVIFIRHTDTRTVTRPRVDRMARTSPDVSS